MKTPAEIVKTMYDGDAFSQWLGIEVLETQAGYCKLQMRVREEMTNGFKIAHGGICFSLADSALAFAANGHGPQAVSIETSISHHKPVPLGAILIAEAKEIKQSRQLGVYEVLVRGEAGELYAHFKGSVLRTGKDW